jgi:hypothetical protein
MARSFFRATRSSVLSMKSERLFFRNLDNVLLVVPGPMAREARPLVEHLPDSWSAGVLQPREA